MSSNVVACLLEQHKFVVQCINELVGLVDRSAAIGLALVRRPYLIDN